MFVWSCDPFNCLIFSTLCHAYVPRLNEPYNDHFLCNLSGGINLWLWPAARHRVLEEWRAPIVAALVRRRIARRPAWQRLFDPKRSYLYGKAVFCPTGILFIRGPWWVPRPSSGSSGTRFGHSPPVFLSQGVGIRLRQNIHHCEKILWGCF